MYKFIWCCYIMYTMKKLCQISSFCAKINSHFQFHFPQTLWSTLIHVYTNTYFLTVLFRIKSTSLNVLNVMALNIKTIIWMQLGIFLPTIPNYSLLSINSKQASFLKIKVLKGNSIKAKERGVFQLLHKWIQRFPKVNQRNRLAI